MHPAPPGIGAKPATLEAAGQVRKAPITLDGAGCKRVLVALLGEKPMTDDECLDLFKRLADPNRFA